MSADAGDREPLAAVHAQCQRLAAVADDLAGLAAEDPTVAPIDATELELAAGASRALPLRERAFSDTGVRLLMSHRGVAIRSDGQRIRQLLGNLRDNCSGYCREGDLVRLAWPIVDFDAPAERFGPLQSPTQMSVSTVRTPATHTRWEQ